MLRNWQMVLTGMITKSMRSSALHLTDEGFAKSSRCLSSRSSIRRIPGPTTSPMLLRSKSCSSRTNYIVRDGEAVIVDEFTGRVMPGRRWSDGHQAIEAKEALVFRRKPRLSPRSLSELLLAHPRLAGMTGTAKTEVEFESYNRDHDCSHQPGACSRLGRSGVQNRTAKWRAVANETADIHKKGRPVLVGTTSVEKRLLSSLLLSRRFPTTCNAKPENVERNRRSWLRLAVPEP